MHQVPRHKCIFRRIIHIRFIPVHICRNAAVSTFYAFYIHMHFCMYTFKRWASRRLSGRRRSAGPCSFVLLSVPASGECCVCYRSVHGRVSPESGGSRCCAGLLRVLRVAGVGRMCCWVHVLRVLEGRCVTSVVFLCARLLCVLRVLYKNVHDVTCSGAWRVLPGSGVWTAGCGLEGGRGCHAAWCAAARVVFVSQWRREDVQLTAAWWGGGAQVFLPLMAW